MDDSEKPSLPPSLRDLIEQERRRLGPHPPVEDLVAYQAGELPADQEERLRDHLALCPECAHLLLDLRDFPDISLPEGARRPSEAEVEAAWEALQPRLGEPRPAEKPAPAPVQPLRPERKPVPYRWPAALAAVFFLSTVGLSFWVASLRRELDRPALEPVGLEARETERGRGEGDEPALRTSKGYLLVLSPLEVAPEPQARYEVSVSRTGSQEVLWEADAHLVREDDSFIVELPAHSLPPGRYRLTLHGGPDRELLGDFSFRIR